LSWIAVSLSQRPTTSNKLTVAGTLRGLTDERPREVALGRHQEQVVQVAKEAQAAAPRAAEQLRVQAVGLVGRVLPVALGERREPLRVVVALGGELAAELTDVGLVVVCVRDLAEHVGQVDLGAVEETEAVRQMHGQPYQDTTRP
jgi:hypothetical protein